MKYLKFLLLLSFFLFVSCITKKVESEKDLFQTPQDITLDTTEEETDTVAEEKSSSEEIKPEEFKTEKITENKPTNKPLKLNLPTKEDLEKKDNAADISVKSKKTETQNNTSSPAKPITSQNSTTKNQQNNSAVQQTKSQTNTQANQTAQQNQNNNQTKQAEQKNTQTQTNNNQQTNNPAKINQNTQTAKNSNAQQNQNNIPNDKQNNTTQKSQTTNTNTTNSNVTNNQQNLANKTQQVTNNVQNKPAQNSNNSVPKNTQPKAIQTPLAKQNNTNNTKANNQTKQNPPVKEEIPEETEESLENKVTPSRQVAIKKGETLSVTYPGSGWIYLGSDAEYNNLISTSRKTENLKTTYLLVAKDSGKQIHHFYKIDNITGNYIDDYLEVEVLNERGNVSNVVKAPDYALLVPEKPVSPALSNKKAPEINTDNNRKSMQYSPETVITKAPEKTTEPELYNDEAPRTFVLPPESPEIDQSIDVSDLLEKAWQCYNNKNYAQANEYINSFLEHSTDRRDEALYLKAQILESDGPQKNIKGSLETYKNLTENYPTSKYWDKANKRIIYLNRFYINIR